MDVSEGRLYCEQPSGALSRASPMHQPEASALSNQALSVPSFLNPVSSQRTVDRAITEFEFGELWRYIRPYAERQVRRALSSVRLVRSEALATRDGQYTAMVSRVTSVRAALEASSLDDLLQEVATALWVAVQRGTAEPERGLRASKHVVKEWVRTTSRQLVQGWVRVPGMLAFAAGSPAPEDNEDDSRDEAEALSRDLAPDECASRGHDWAAITKCLKPAEQAILRLRLEGLEHAEIASRIGLTPVATRVALCRTMKTVREQNSNRRPFTSNDRAA